MIYPPHYEALVQAKATRLLRANVSNTLEEFGLSMPEWTLLGVLADAEDLRLAQVAATLDVEAPLVSVLAKDLQKKELIEQSPDPKDSRAKLLNITQQGRGLIRALDFLVHQSLAPLMEGISDEALRGYFQVLEGIIANEPGSVSKS